MQLRFWSPPTKPIESLPPPPQDTERTFVNTDAGRLEVLITKPASGVASKGPVLFLHGGFGSAECYSNYLPFFAGRGYPSYSMSLRGHGNSWYPSCFSMLFTSKHTLATDVAAVIDHISEQHGGKPVALVGHSSGGGLSQYTLHAGLAKVRALGLVGAIPSFGGFLVYNNWFMLDPWYPLRVLKDFSHPRSPLSSTSLVHGAFFSPEYPVEKVKAFENTMPMIESLLWPMGMMWPFVSNKKVLQNIVSKSDAKPKVLVVAGEKDTLVGVKIPRWTAQRYASAAGTKLVLDTKKVEDTKNEVVSFHMTPKSGHNLMKDLYWKDSAERIAKFLDEVE